MEDAEVDIVKIALTIKRQWHIVLASSLVVAMIGGAVIFALPTVYSSSALILIDPSPKDLLDPVSQVASAAADSARVDSEVELMRSDTVVIEVIRNLNLASTAEFAPGLDLGASLMALVGNGTVAPSAGDQVLDQTLTKLKRAIIVQRRGLTYLVTVEAHSRSSALATDIANNVAQAYIARQVQSKVDSLLQSQALLDARLEQARLALTQSEVRFDTFIEQNFDRIAAGSSLSNVRNLQAELNSLDSSQDELARTAERVTQGLAGNDWKSVVDQLHDAALDELERQHSVLSAQIRSGAVGSPIELDLRQRLTDVEGQMHAAIQGHVSDLQQRLIDGQQQADALRQQLRQLVLQGELSGEILTELYEAQQDAQLARAQYQNLLARSHDLDAEADLQLADSRVVSPALASSVPVSPNNWLILLISFLAGPCFGVVLALLYEKVAGQFVSEEQLAAALGIPVAASVPWVRATTERDSPANLPLTAPLSGFSESTRRLRAAIDQSLRRLELSDFMAPVIMVSSTESNEGKSTLSLALGRCYALSGARTLLIDADLRKPGIHRHLGASPTTGLLDFLEHPEPHHSQIADMLVHDASGLSLLLGARPSEVPTDQLLTRDNFRRLIIAARHSFDVVIVDTPPLGPVVDATYIGQYANVVLFVCKWAAGSRTQALRAMTLLRTSIADSTPQVAVLNGVPAPHSAHTRVDKADYLEN